MAIGCFRRSARPTDNTKGERQICRVVANMSVCGANERTFPEGRGPANDSCRDSVHVAGPKTRTSDQIANDQIPTIDRTLEINRSAAKSLTGPDGLKPPRSMNARLGSNVMSSLGGTIPCRGKQSLGKDSHTAAAGHARLRECRIRSYGRRRGGRYRRPRLAGWR